MPLDFTAEDIVEAFARTGIKPVPGLTLEIRSGKPCGCPLAAMAVDRSGLGPSEWLRGNVPFLFAAISIPLGLTQYEMSGLAAGFDGESMSALALIDDDEAADQFEAAYHVGAEARRLLCT